ncbi:MAG: hypothetical protein K8R38_00360, partial [Verrucomicrobia bacterium]|nr:hypothetical protein [Verrucomicrobiota bacterium]
MIQSILRRTFAVLIAGLLFLTATALIAQEPPSQPVPPTPAPSEVSPSVPQSAPSNEETISIQFPHTSVAEVLTV